MRTPTYAICWELWRTSWVSLATTLSGTSGIVLAFQGFIAKANIDGSLEALQGLIIILVLVASTLSMFWLRELSTEGHSFTFRLGFTRPVSTKQLVLLRLGWAIIGAMVCFAVPITLFGLFSGTPMPLFGPLLIIAAAVSWFIAGTWIPTTTVERTCGAVFAAVGFGLFLFQYHQYFEGKEPYVLAIGKSGYFDLGWRSVVVLVGTMVTAIVATILGVDRQRHGGSVTLVGFIPSLVTKLTRTHDAVSNTTAFQSPTRAQLWFDLKRSAPRVLAVAAIAPLAIFVLAKWALWMHGRQEESEFVTAWEGAPVLWALGLLIGPVIYQLLGVDAVLGLRLREGVIRFSSFDATRAMSSERLIILKLLVTGACSLVGWLWMCGWALAYAFFAEDGTVWLRVQDAAEQLGSVPVGWWFGAFICLAMSFLAITSLMMLFAMWMPMYPKRFTAFFVICYVHMIVGFVGNQKHWELESFWRSYGFVAACTLALLALYASVVAVKDGTVTPRVASLVVGLWLGYVGCVVWVASRVPALEILPSSAVALAVSALLLPLAATLRTPMALDAWRHRA